MTRYSEWSSYPVHMVLLLLFHVGVGVHPADVDLVVVDGMKGSNDLREWQPPGSFAVRRPVQEK